MVEKGLSAPTPTCWGGSFAAAEMVRAGRPTYGVGITSDSRCARDGTPSVQRADERLAGASLVWTRSMVRVAERDSDALGLLRGRTGLGEVAYQPLRATQGSGDRKRHQDEASGYS